MEADERGSLPVDDPLPVRSDFQAAPRRSRSTGAIIAIVIGVVALVVVLIVGVVAAFGIFGARRYVLNAKAAEARVAVTAIAQGVARCSTPRGSVPESSPPVPAELSMVRAQRYQSAPDDWSHQAFRCSGFSLQNPQYFQYQWLRESDSGGMVVARADLDGDGTAEVQVELDVICGASGCKAAGAARETLP